MVKANIGDQVGILSFAWAYFPQAEAAYAPLSAYAHAEVKSLGAALKRLALSSAWLEHALNQALSEVDATIKV